MSKNFRYLFFAILSFQIIEIPLFYFLIGEHASSYFFTSWIVFMVVISMLSALLTDKKNVQNLYLVLGAAFALLVVTNIYSLSILKTKFSKIVDTRENTDVNKLTNVRGIIYTSGLLDDDMVSLGIDSKYQVEIAPEERVGERQSIKGYYLITDMDLSGDIWKCVEVSGNVPDSWKNLRQNGFKVNGNTTHFRSAVEVSNINFLPDNECIPDFDFTITDKEEASGYLKGSYQGTLKFREIRPSPDIHYDLQLDLSEPTVIDDPLVRGDEVKVTTIDIAALTDEILGTIKENIGKDVVVDGFWEYGAAESRFFRVTSVNLL